MVQLVLWFVALTLAAIGLLSVSPGDEGKAAQHAAAERIFRGVALAKGLANQNFSLSGRYEGDAPAVMYGSPYLAWNQYNAAWDTPNWQMLFPVMTQSAFYPPSLPYARDGNGVVTSLTVSAARKSSSGDLFWPQESAYAIFCGKGKATSGLDSAALAPCSTPADQTAGHRYLAIIFSSTGGSCNPATSGRLQSLAELLAVQAPRWSKRLGTDVWLKGAASVGADGTPLPTATGCPELRIYLGKNVR